MTQPQFTAFATCSQPFFQQAVAGDTPIVYTSTDFRLHSTAILRRSGILDSQDLWVSQAANVGFRIKVAFGAANVGGAGVNGAYLVNLPASVEISLLGFNTSPPATRTHQVWVAVYDKQIQGLTDYSGRIVVTEDKGIGAPDPVDGSWIGQAVASLPLATVTMGPGQPNVQNSNIVNNPRHGGVSGSYYSLVNNVYTIYENNSGSDAADFRVWYHNGTARLGGSVRPKTGTFVPSPAAGVTIGRLPPYFWPQSARYLTCATTFDGGGGFTCRLRIDTDGALVLHIPAGQKPSAVVFDGLTYDLD